MTISTKSDRNITPKQTVSEVNITDVANENYDMNYDICEQHSLCLLAHTHDS